jgi:putative ABC transport system permease protein
MLKSYLRIARRILARNKLYTLINVLGLAIGVCICIVIWLVDSAELNIDRFHPDADRIYRVDAGSKDGEIKLAIILPWMPEAMRAAIPALESMTAYTPFNISQKVEVPIDGHSTREFQSTLEGESKESGIIIADSGWFHIFPYRWIAGNPATALAGANQVVLTESAATRYFGSPSQAMGRELIYADSLHVHVTGVVKDWTQHSDLAYTDIISLPTIDVSFLKDTWHLHSYEARMGPDYQWFNGYVKLVKGASIARVEQQMDALADQHQTITPAGPYVQTLQPLSDVHFNADYQNGRHTAHRPTLYALAGVALFILILAAVNYINLATAQSLQRAKEIGVRKVLGSGKRKLMGQFLVETGVLTLLALLIAVGLVWPAMRVFSDYMPPRIHFNPLTLPNLLFLGGVLVVVTLGAGFYPARVLAGYQPVQSLKGSGSVKGGERWWLRRSLVVFQFAISLVFIIVTLVIGNQIRFMLNTDYGFKADAIVTVRGQGGPGSQGAHGGNLDVLRQRYSALPGIAEVIQENNPPLGWGAMGTMLTYKGKNLVQFMVTVQVADEKFIPFYNMRLAAGRNLRHSDTLAEYVINETTARRMGFMDPSKAVGQFLYSGDQAIPIVGVVADYHQGGLQREIVPVVLGEDRPRGFHSLGIRLASTGQSVDNVKATLGSMEKIYKEIYPGANFEYKFMDESIRKMYESEQKTAALVRFVMGLAIFISCMGLFGLSLFTTERRAGEIGVRKVFGASAMDIAILLNRQYVKLVLISLVIACPFAWLLARQWLRNFAYRVPMDAWVFVIAGLSAIALALLTVSYQSIRAALANPIKSLRAE